MARKLSLLIVDDDKDLLDPVVEVCERFNFSVIGACSGERALELIDAHHIDAVLTDIRMQPMGGFALLEKVRLAKPGIPFILWTGFWDRPDDKRAAQFENIEKLEKPFTFRELEQVLNRVRAKILAAGDGDGDGDGAGSREGGAVGGVATSGAAGGSSASSNATTGASSSGSANAPTASGATDSMNRAVRANLGDRP